MTCEKKSRHLIACGSYATSFLVKYGKELNFDSFTIVNASIPDNCGVDVEFIHFPELKVLSYFKAWKKMPPRLKEILETKTGEIICYAALGYGSGTGLYEAIGKVCRDLPNPTRVKFVSTRPVEAEGRYPVELAERVVLSLTDLFDQKSACLERLKEESVYYNLEDAYKNGDTWVLLQMKKI